MAIIEEIWKEYWLFNSEDHEYDSLSMDNFGKYLKSKYSKDDLRNFYIWLRKNHSWCYACLNNKTGTDVWDYRGYSVGVIKMVARKLECGLYDHTNSWLWNGDGIRRPSEVYQVEILKKGKDIFEGEVLYYGYIEKPYYTTIKAMLDKLIKEIHVRNTKTRLGI